MAKKTTKKQLLQEIDETLQKLNLLKSALEKDPTRKQEDIANYQKQFYQIMNRK